MKSRLDELSSRWEAASGPSASRMKPWATRMLDAARTSIDCGLMAQAGLLLDRVERAIPRDEASTRSFEISVKWNGEGLPRMPGTKREEELWRRVRSLRSARRPYDGAQHPERKGLAWGPYNRASAVVETLEMAARVDPLWVDDFLERDRAAGAIDRLLGITG